MLNTLKRFCVLLLAGSHISLTVQAQEPVVADPTLRFYTELIAPYYYLDEDEKPQGATVDLAAALQAETQLTGSVEHLPWARALVETMNKPNIVLLTALRTNERETQLQWLGVVHRVEAQFIALNENQHFNIQQLSDAKAFMVGTIRGYGAAHYLLNNGFEEGENLELVSSQRQLWMMLFRQRIDLVLDNLTTGRFQIFGAGLDKDNVHVVATAKELSNDLEMATGHLTDVRLANKLRAGLQRLKDKGVYQRILEKWELQNISSTNTHIH